MSRDWKSKTDEEIYAIWQSFLISEHDYLCQVKIPMRITYSEIINLVDNLFDRLKIKKEKEDV